MALYNGDKKIASIYHKLKDNTLIAIKYIYNGSKLVWSIVKDILSAFGAGFWQNDQTWSNDEGWKNEP